MFSRVFVFVFLVHASNPTVIFVENICDVPVLDASAVTAMEAVAPAPGARSAVAGWGRGAASPGTSAEVAVAGADVLVPVPSAPWAIFVLRSAPRPKMVAPSPSRGARAVGRGCRR